SARDTGVACESGTPGLRRGDRINTESGALLGLAPAYCFRRETLSARREAADCGPPPHLVEVSRARWAAVSVPRAGSAACLPACCCWRRAEPHRRRKPR